MAGLMLMLTLAWAGTREQGELTRLVDEMDQQSERQAWTSVDRTYGKILELTGVTVPRDVHISAAHAARATGDMAEVVARLERAQAVERTDEEQTWLSSINEQFSHVELRVVPARSVDLTVEIMPFEPDARQAVERATVALVDDGEFVGMLPIGEYQLAGKPFTVTAGYTAHVELSSKELKAAKKAQ